MTLTLLLALVGVAQRYRETDAGPAAQPPPVQPVTSPPARPTSSPPDAPGTLHEGMIEAPRAAAPVAAFTASASPGDAPPANAGVTRRPVKPPPRAAFTPPFQLPGEKN